RRAGVGRDLRAGGGPPAAASPARVVRRLRLRPRGAPRLPRVRVGDGGGAMRHRRIIALAAILLLLGTALSLASAVAAAAGSNVDAWREERPVRASPSHLPSYLRGVWSDPIEVTTTRGASWGVSQTTITCVDPGAWTPGAAAPPPDPDLLPCVFVTRSGFGWPLRCMHYDLFGTSQKLSRPAWATFIGDLTARAG